MRNFKENVREYVKLYYVKNDGAHQIDHADKVYNDFKYCVSELKLDMSLDMIAVIAYCHDMFSTIEYRKVHEQKAADWILENNNIDFLKKFSDTDIKTISNAIREHRASYKGEFSSIYSELMNLADRGNLELNETLKRSFKYHYDRMEIINDKNIDKACNNVLSHMIEKFGSSGYFQPNELYLKVFEKDYKNFVKSIDNLDIKQVKNIVL